MSIKLIILTEPDDLADIAFYIGDKAMDLSIGKEYVDKIVIKIDELESQPYKGRKVDNPYLAKKGIRRLNFEEYAIFYTVDKKKEIVNIITAGRQNRNWDYRLKNIV